MVRRWLRSFTSRVLVASYVGLFSGLWLLLFCTCLLYDLDYVGILLGFCICAVFMAFFLWRGVRQVESFAGCSFDICGK